MSLGITARLVQRFGAPQTLLAYGLPGATAAVAGYQVAYVLAALSVGVGLLAVQVMFRTRQVPGRASQPAEVVELEPRVEDDWRALDAA